MTFSPEPTLSASICNVSRSTSISVKRCLAKPPSRSVRSPITRNNSIAAVALPSGPEDRWSTAHSLISAFRRDFLIRIDPCAAHATFQFDERQPRIDGSQTSWQREYLSWHLIVREVPAPHDGIVGRCPSLFREGVGCGSSSNLLKLLSAATLSMMPLERRTYFIFGASQDG
jgi:hypothetical protein